MNASEQDLSHDLKNQINSTENYKNHILDAQLDFLRLQNSRNNQILDKNEFKQDAFLQNTKSKRDNNDIFNKTETLDASNSAETSEDETTLLEPLREDLVGHNQNNLEIDKSANNQAEETYQYSNEIYADEEGNFILKDNDIENQLTQIILEQNMADVSIYTDQNVSTISSLQDEWTTESAIKQATEELEQVLDDISQVKPVTQNETENMTVTTDTEISNEAEDEIPEGLQDALDAVNIKQPERVEPQINTVEIRTDMNQENNDNNNENNSVKSNQSESWYEAATAYINDKKERIKSTIANKDEPSTQPKEAVYEEIEVEGLFEGVGHSLVNGAKGIAKIGTYTKIGFTEGAKDSKEVVSKLYSKIKG